MTSVATRAKVLSGAAKERIGQRNPLDFKASPNERYLFAMRNLVGLPVTVQLVNGTRYDGILASGWWDNDCPAEAAGSAKGVVLKVVRQVVGPDDLAKTAVESRVFVHKEMVSLVAKDADLYNDERTIVARGIGDGVLADTEIEVEGRGAGAERELVAASAWLGDDTSIGALDTSSLKGNKGGSWDQFRVNEKMGGKSSYHDELYTTKISDKKFSAEQLARAERLAREIELGESTNSHVLEERGLKELHDETDDMDEEEKYSMVLGRPEEPGMPPPPPPTAPAPVPATPMSKAAESGVAAEKKDTPASGAPSLETPKVPSKLGTKLSASAKVFVPGQFAHKVDTSATPEQPPHPPSGTPPIGYGGSPRGNAGMMAGPGGVSPSGMYPGMHPGVSPMGSSPGMSPQQYHQQMAMHQHQQQQQMQQQQQQQQQQQMQQQQQQQQQQRQGMGMPVQMQQPGMMMPMMGPHGMMQGHAGMAMPVPMMQGAMQGAMQPGHAMISPTGGQRQAGSMVGQMGARGGPPNMMQGGQQMGMGYGMAPQGMAHMQHVQAMGQGMPQQMGPPRPGFSQGGQPPASS